MPIQMPDAPQIEYSDVGPLDTAYVPGDYDLDYEPYEYETTGMGFEDYGSYGDAYDDAYGDYQIETNPDLYLDYDDQFEDYDLGEGDEEGSSWWKGLLGNKSLWSTIGKIGLGALGMLNKRQPSLMKRSGGGGGGGGGAPKTTTIGKLPTVQGTYTGKQSVLAAKAPSK